MKILSLFSRPSLKPSWTFTPEGTIWRLYPARSGELVGEARNQETKRVSFFALDGETGKPFWQNIAFEEPWWIGIEEVTNSVIVLHKFASPDMPEHRGIIVVDLRTGKSLWSNDELTYWFAFEGSIFVHKMMFEKRIASEFDIHSGQMLRDFGEELEPSLFQKREEAIRANQERLLFPEIGELDRIDPSISAIMKKELPRGGIRGPVEYAQHGRHLLMNYHVPAGETSDDKPLLDNRLRILDADSGRVLYGETIVRNSPAVVPDSFFVRDGTLYFVKDENTLTAVHLSQ